jgi:hypothetical protein
MTDTDFEKEVQTISQLQGLIAAKASQAGRRRRGGAPRTSLPG